MKRKIQIVNLQPGSMVTIEAVGIDSSGRPAEIRNGIDWTVRPRGRVSLRPSGNGIRCEVSYVTPGTQIITAKDARTGELKSKVRINTLAPALAEFYLQDSRTYVGNDVLWWAQDGKGYTCDIRKAHVFTKEEADHQHKTRKTDVPWPKQFVDENSQPVLDMQVKWKLADWMKGK